MDRAQWQRVSEALDALLALEGEARAAHLAHLTAEDAAFGEQLAQLLAHEDTEDPRVDQPIVTSPPGLAIGETLGPYTLDGKLGEGGMGQVWRAHRSDGLHQIPLALKLLRPGLADTQLRTRFNREREILARLAHPNIARLLDAGIAHSGVPYLALEYVEGKSLLTFARDRNLDIDSRIDLFKQVCDAVSHAHANLVVHRDLKPSNILVTDKGQVRLLDFGIGKLLEESDEPVEHTHTGLRPFTLHYAAPEQIRGETVSTRTDVYSLGVVLYELLTGKKPYRLKRESSAQWEEAILSAEAVKPSQAALQSERADARRISRTLSGDLDNIILKALAKQPANRYTSVEALSADLNRYQEGLPVKARPQSFGYRARKFLARHRMPILGGLGLAAVVFTLLGVALWQRSEAVRETARAQAMQSFMVGLFENADAAQKGKPEDVATLIDAAEARGERELIRQPRAHAELLAMIARIRIALGQYDRAATVLARQARLLASVTDAPASLTLEAATQTGRVQRLLGFPSRCIAALAPKVTLATNEQAQLPAHVSDFYSQYARCLRTGNAASARYYFERSLSLRRSALGDDIGVVENLTDLAALSFDAHDYPDALKRFKDALAKLRALGGDRHVLSIDLLRSIGSTYLAMHDLPAASAAFSEALDHSIELQGPNHPQTLVLRRALAQGYVEQGRYVDAAREFQLVQNALNTRPQGIADAIRSQIDMAAMAQQMGHLEEAQAGYQRAVRLANGRTANASAQLEALAGLASVYRELGNGPAALRTASAARKIASTNAAIPAVVENRILEEIAETQISDGQNTQALETLDPVLRKSGARASKAQALNLHARARMAEQMHDLSRTRELMQIASRLAGSATPTDQELVWRLRAYDADALCRITADDGKKAFAALIQEIKQARPDGSSRLRATTDLATHCGQKVIAIPAATPPTALL